MIQDYFLRNLWLKLASVVLATLIWLTVQANVEKETRLVQQMPVSADEFERRGIAQRHFEVVPVVTRCNSTNCPAFRADPATVSVDLSGESQRIWNMEGREMTAYVEIGDQPRAGDLCPIQVSTPPGVTWLRVLPNVVRLRPGTTP
jgi:hypothetical protein